MKYAAGGNTPTVSLCVLVKLLHRQPPQNRHHRHCNRRSQSHQNLAIQHALPPSLPLQPEPPRRRHRRSGILSAEPRNGESTAIVLLLRSQSPSSTAPHRKWSKACQT